jgi:KaiC/GvpD/RAD55 family RecA-like ATPase
VISKREAGSLELQEEIVPDKSGSHERERHLRLEEAFTAPILRDVLPEGLPVPSVVLILSDPEAGRELLTLELLSTRLRTGNRVLWITLENFPSARKAMFEFAGLEKGINERPENLEFVDCYSSQVGVRSTERYSADPSNLPNLSVATSLAISKLSREAHLVVMLDSLSALVEMAGPRAATEFFRTLVGKVRSVQGDLLTTLNRRAFSSAILASIQEMVDGVIELRITDDEADVRRYLRVRKMLGTRYDSASISYDIDQKHGVFRRSESNSDAFVSGPTIGTDAREVTKDLRHQALSNSASNAVPLWKVNSNINELPLAKNRPYSYGDMPSQTPTSTGHPAESGLTNVEEAMLEAIDRGLLALGKVVRDTIYDRFDRMYQLRHEEIPVKLNTFHEALQTMFGAGAKVIETQIAKGFSARLGSGFTENENWTIVDYFELAKRAKA